MKLERIIYLDSYIKIFFVKTEKEINTITPALVQCITLLYSIRLIDSPGRKVTEQIKINKENISFINDFMVISFSITDLHSPDRCELSLHTLNIHFKDSYLLRIKINKTHTFKSIQAAIPPFIPQKINPKAQITKKEKNPKTNILTKPKTKKKIEIMKKKEEYSKPNFIDSYEKFKANLQGTDLLDLLRKKTDSIDFNLKNFGISLLCKLLLLVKYINELVDNEFQNDLQEFLKTNILKSVEEGVLT